MTAKELLFTEETLDFYLRLDEVQKAHFWEWATKHPEFMLNDVCNIIEKLEKVIEK